MTSRSLVLGLGLAAGLLPACSGDRADLTDPDPDPQDGLTVELVVQGLPEPVHLTAPPGDDRLFVLEQGGRIRIVRQGTLLEAPFLDLREEVGSGGERGLLSIAFHPDYASNGHVYVNYTEMSGGSRVVRYSVSADPDLADPASAVPILSVNQPQANHNGGHILFGPDGMLYIAMGDGGGGGDPGNHGQNSGTLLGALLRIDVDGGDPYAIPQDNPFADDPDGRGEIWAMGLRNPWRMSFDEVDGMLYIADVGQNRWEEVNAVPADEPGLNYGWNVMEGFECFQVDTCPQQGLTLPVLTYRTGQVGRAIVGGSVYRGAALPEVAGHYFYSDWSGGWLRSFRLQQGEAVDERAWDVGDLSPVLSMGEDAAGEIYLLSAAGGGTVYRVVPDGG